MDSKMKKNLLLMVVVWVWAIANSMDIICLRWLTVKLKDIQTTKKHCKTTLNSIRQLLLWVK